MTEMEDLFQALYAAFNKREIAAALEPMSESVSWPKASEGGRVVGKKEIGSYWQRQWAAFDPNVTPIAVHDHGNGTVDVRVHQVVRTLAGELLSDSEVLHRYTFSNGRIERMDLDGESSAREAPSAAFSHD